MSTTRSVLRICMVVMAGFICTGAALAQQRLDGTGKGALYGFGLAAGDGLLAVGTNSGGGYVDIYRRDPAGWELDARVLPTDGNAFGYRVALGGGWLAVANTDIHVAGWPNYIDLFRRDSEGVWQFVQRVESPGGAPFFDVDYIDRMYVMHNALVISIRRYDALGATVGFRTFSYDYDVSDQSWGAAQQLLPPYAAPFFGAAISLEGEQLAVADFKAQVSGSIGVVSIYRRVGMNWVHATALLSPQSAQWLFGNEVALCGTRLAVLAVPRVFQPAPPPGQNRVFLYKGESVSWSSDGAPLVSPLPLSQGYNNFGRSLSCSREALAMRGEARSTAHALSLTGVRTLHELTVAPPYNSAGETIAVHGGDVLLGDYRGPNPPPKPSSGAVFAFNGAVDSIFVHAFE